MTQHGGEHDADAQDSLVGKYVELVCKIGSNRAWTYLLQSVPPFKYVPAASNDVGVAEDCLGMMKSDWEALLALEREALTNDSSKELLEHMVWPRKKAVRLLFMLFERDQWSPTSVAGQRYHGGGVRNGDF